MVDMVNSNAKGLEDVFLGPLGSYLISTGHPIKRPAPIQVISADRPLGQHRARGDLTERARAVGVSLRQP